MRNFPQFTSLFVRFSPHVFSRFFQAAVVTKEVFVLFLSTVLNVYQDCDDSSDEKNCRMVSFDEEKYLKNKPPPSPSGMQKLPITVRKAAALNRYLLSLLD